MLENPGKTLMAAGTALIIGTFIVVFGLNMVHWALG